MVFLGYALIAGGVWKGDIMVADVEELEKLDASEKYHRKLNVKDVLITHKKCRIGISCDQWFSKIVRKRPRIPGTQFKARRNCKECFLEHAVTSQQLVHVENFRTLLSNKTQSIFH